MRSIRRALAVRLLGSLAVIALVVGTALFLGVRFALVRQFDRTLLARLDAMQSATRWDGSKIDVDFTAEAMPWYRAGNGAEYFEVRGGGATMIAPFRSPSLGGSAWEAPFAVQSGLVNLRLPDGRAGRAAVTTFRPLPEEELDEAGREAARQQAVDTAPVVSLAVAMSREDLDATLRIIAVALLASAGVIALGVVAAVRSSVARGLRPLESLSAQVSRVRADSLSTRVTLVQEPDELRTIRCRVNELIERLDEAFKREQRFTTAAAHELRTPVAELRTLLEVSLSRARTAEEHRAALREALDITLRAERLVATLLKVARGRSAPDPESVPISPASILKEVVARHTRAATDRGGKVEVIIRSEAQWPGDAAVLTSAVENLIGNAVEYANPAPLVTCEVGEDAQGSVTVAVRNPAEDLEPSDVEQFFEPFWRRNQSRSPSDHLGMGLVITRSLVESMGGTVEATLERPYITVRVTMPGPKHRARTSPQDNKPEPMLGRS